MTTGGLLLLALLGASPEAVLIPAQAEQRAVPARRPARTGRAELQPSLRTAPALGPAPPLTAAPRSGREVAPMPNRSLEAPRPAPAAEVPSFRPDLIEPRGLPDGTGASRYSERQDRFIRDPAPGARLSIPFRY